MFWAGLEHNITNRKTFTLFTCNFLKLPERIQNGSPQIIVSCFSWKQKTKKTFAVKIAIFCWSNRQNFREIAVLNNSWRLPFWDKVHCEHRIKFPMKCHFQMPVLLCWPSVIDLHLPSKQTATKSGFVVANDFTLGCQTSDSASISKFNHLALLACLWHIVQIFTTSPCLER